MGLSKSTGNITLIDKYVGCLPFERFAIQNLNCFVILPITFVLILNKLPDNADMEEIMYRLYVLDKVRKGQGDVESGSTISDQELGQEIDTW